MVFYFEIPLIIIFFILIAVVGLGAKIAAAAVFWIFVIIFAIYWIMAAVVLINSALHKNSIMGVILSVAICILGFIISMFIFKNFYYLEDGKKTLLEILACLIVVQVAIWLAIEKTKLVDFICMLCLLAVIVICCIWTIGYNLSYPVKSTVSNIAYFECVERETKAGVIPYVNRNIYDIYSSDIRTISDDHIIGSYEVGERLQPAHGMEYVEGYAWESVYNHTWYSVYTEDGQVGWIPISEIKVYYYRESESIEKRQNEILGKHWYGYLPRTFLKTCESFFEKLPRRYKLNFVEQ